LREWPARLPLAAFAPNQKAQARRADENDEALIEPE